VNRPPLSSEATQECVSCGMKIIARFGDTRGWRGLQMAPNDAESFRWYCKNELCQQAFEEAFSEAEKAWSGEG